MWRCRSQKNPSSDQFNSLFDSKLVHFSSASSQRPHWLLFVAPSCAPSLTIKPPPPLISPSVGSECVLQSSSSCFPFSLPCFCFSFTNPSPILHFPDSFTLPFHPLCFTSPSSWFSISPLLSLLPPSLPSSFSSSVSSHLFLISLVFSPVLSVICFPPFVLRPPPFPPHLLA